MVSTWKNGGGSETYVSASSGRNQRSGTDHTVLVLYCPHDTLPLVLPALLYLLMEEGHER